MSASPTLSFIHPLLTNEAISISLSNIDELEAEVLDATFLGDDGHIAISRGLLLRTILRHLKLERIKIIEGSSDTSDEEDNDMQSQQLIGIEERVEPVQPRNIFRPAAAALPFLLRRRPGVALQYKRVCLAPKQSFRKLPYHVILLSLEYLERQIEFDTTRQQQLIGRFAADPTRTPILLFSTLILANNSLKFSQTIPDTAAFILRRVKRLTVVFHQRTHQQHPLIKQIVSHASVTSMPQLQSISINHGVYNSNIFQLFNEYFMSKIRQVISLERSITFAQDTPVEVIQQLQQTGFSHEIGQQQIPQLRHISYLDKAPGDEEDIATIAQHALALQHLALGFQMPVEPSKLLPLKSLSNLRELTVYGSNPFDFAIPILGPRIRKLCLHAFVENLDNLEQMPFLEKLAFQTKNIDTCDVIKLLDLRCLSILSIQLCSYSPVLHRILQQICIGRLTHLSLRQCDAATSKWIDDDHVKSLVNSKNCSLMSFSLCVRSMESFLGDDAESIPILRQQFQQLACCLLS